MTVTLTTTATLRKPTMAGAVVGVYSRASKDGSGKETSVTAQAMLGRKLAQDDGAAEVIDYVENARSASRYALKDRPAFARMIEDACAGRLDWIWVLNQSRFSRNQSVWGPCRDRLMAAGTGIKIGTKTRDWNDPSDQRAMGTDTVNAETQSQEISLVVKMGIGLAALNGQPHGRLTYGYRRTYDTTQAKRVYTGTYPEPDQAAIVREVFRRVAEGEPLTVIADDLTAREVPTPQGGERWVRSVLRAIVVNRTYLGECLRQGVTVPDCWQPLVSVELFHAAGAVLGDPKRKTTRPGRGKHRLSYIVRCECGQYVQMKKNTGDRRELYACVNRCSAVGRVELDDFVREVIDGTLNRPDIREAIAAARTPDPAASAARADAAAERAALARWEAARDAGTVEPADFAPAAAGCRRRIAEAEARADALTLPNALPHDLTVPWDDVPKARRMIDAMCSITLHSVGKGRRNVEITDRVDWVWKIPGI
jgi:DNA invertase Pin-like site-specific DNA recombinase